MCNANDEIQKNKTQKKHTNSVEGSKNQIKNAYLQNKKQKRKIYLPKKSGENSHNDRSIICISF